MFGGWELFYLASFLLGFGYLLILGVMSGGGGSDSDVGGDGGDVPEANLELEAHGELDAHGDLDGHDLDHAGDGHEIDAAHHDHGAAGHEYSFFTPLVMASLLAGVGGAGLFGSLTLNLPWLFHLPLAALGGLGVGRLIWWLFARVIYPMQGSSEVRVHKLWGTVAEVTTPIPANRLGEIRFVAGGSYVSTPARSATGEMLPRGQIVVIEKIENSIAIVRATR